MTEFCKDCPKFCFHYCPQINHLFKNGRKNVVSRVRERGLCRICRIGNVKCLKNYNTGVFSLIILRWNILMFPIFAKKFTPIHWINQFIPNLIFSAICRVDISTREVFVSIIIENWAMCRYALIMVCWVKSCDEPLKIEWSYKDINLIIIEL